MPNLRASIESLANAFAHQLLGEIRRMSLDEILSISKHGGGSAASKAPKAAAPKAAAAKAAPKAAAAPKKKGGRLVRRSVEEIEKEVGRIVALLKGNGKGLNSEQIQAKLGVSKEELASPLQRALGSKKVRKTGERRGTTYFAK